MLLWRKPFLFVEFVMNGVIYLINWVVVKAGSQQYLAGFNVREGEWRISSKIKLFSTKYLISQTESGRTYQLVGPSIKDFTKIDGLATIIQYWATQYDVAAYSVHESYNKYA